MQLLFSRCHPFIYEIEVAADVAISSLVVWEMGKTLVGVGMGVWSEMRIGRGGRGHRVLCFAHIDPQLGWSCAGAGLKGGPFVNRRCEPPCSFSPKFITTWNFDQKTLFSCVACTAVSQRRVARIDQT